MTSDSSYKVLGKAGLDRVNQVSIRKRRCPDKLFAREPVRSDLAKKGLAKNRQKMERLQKIIGLIKPLPTERLYQLHPTVMLHNVRFDLSLSCSVEFLPIFTDYKTLLYLRLYSRPIWGVQSPNR